MRIAIYMILWLLTSGYALLVGGKPERAGTAILLWINGGSLFLALPTSANALDVNLGGIVLDGLATPACFMLALLTRRYWTLWFCAAQLVALMGHMVHYMLPGEAGLAYFIMTRAPGYIQSIALLVGTIAIQRARTTSLPSGADSGRQPGNRPSSPTDTSWPR